MRCWRAPIPQVPWLSQPRPVQQAENSCRFRFFLKTLVARKAFAVGIWIEAELFRGTRSMNVAGRSVERSREKTLSHGGGEAYGSFSRVGQRKCGTVLRQTGEINSRGQRRFSIVETVGTVAKPILWFSTARWAASCRAGVAFFRASQLRRWSLQQTGLKKLGHSQRENRR